MADNAMPKVGDVVADKYQIEGILGEGGMGAVFSARHKLTGKRIALKWMLPELAKDPDAVQRFMREAQAAGRIDHPNVVDIYDVNQHEGAFFLVMEHLTGETFTVAIERGDMEVKDVIEVLMSAMRGVRAAHKMGVVHRDLKPDNIFLCRDSDGRYLGPKVLDFGISKLSVEEGMINPKLTKTGAVMGTPYYMSPEQVRGSADVDHRADVYAFGVILYEALTGSVPFHADTYSALILEIATGTAVMPRVRRPELSEGLEQVIMKAIARETADRYQDIDALTAALAPHAAEAGVALERPDPTGANKALAVGGATSTPFVSEVPIDVPRRRYAGLMLGVGAAVLLSAVGIWALGGEDSPDANVVKPAVVAAAEVVAAQKAAEQKAAEQKAAEEKAAAQKAAEEKAAAQKAAGEKAAAEKLAAETAAAQKAAATRSKGGKSAAKVAAAKAAAKRKRQEARKAAAEEARLERARRRDQPKPASSYSYRPPPRPAAPTARPKPAAPVRKGRTGTLDVTEF